jgi:hypothetical protein
VKQIEEDLRASMEGAATSGAEAAERAAEELLAARLPLADLARLALGFLHAGRFAAPLDEKAEADKTVAEATLAHPSAHTCVAMNLLAVHSLLGEGRDSRFAQLGFVPPVYLALALNYEREGEEGPVLTCEPQDRAGQGGSRAEARAFPAVRAALGEALVKSGCDWLEAFFKRSFRLDEALFEVYGADGAFVENVRGARPAPPEGGLVCEARTLSRTSLGGFAAAAAGSGARAGAALVLREGAGELFGIWFSWLLDPAGRELVVVDLQNRAFFSGDGALGAAVEALRWSEAPRAESVVWLARR